MVGWGLLSRVGVVGPVDSNRTEAGTFGAGLRIRRYVFIGFFAAHSAQKSSGCRRRVGSNSTQWPAWRSYVYCTANSRGPLRQGNR